MNKIKRNLGYSLISILVLLVLVFTVYGQKDIPVEKIKAKYVFLTHTILKITSLILKLYKLLS